MPALVSRVALIFLLLSKSDLLPICQKMSVFSPTCGNPVYHDFRLLIVGAFPMTTADIPLSRRRDGWNVEFAEDGVGAVQILRSDNVPTLVIFDWAKYSPDIWRDLCELKHGAPVYLIALLNQEELENEAKILEQGADDCVFRPIDKENLRFRLRCGSQVLEHVMRDSEQGYRIAFEQSAMGMALIELPTGRFLHVNKALCELFGYTQEELLAKTIMSVSHPENVPSSELFTARLAAGELHGEQVERRYLRRDGAMVLALISISLVRYEQGRKVTAVQFKDVTNHKGAEEAQQRAEMFAHAIMDNIDDLVMVVETAGKWFYASASHLPALGYTPKELVGESAFFTLHPEDQSLVENAMQQVLRTGRAPTVRVRRVHKDGGILHFEARATLARGLCHGQDGIVVVSRNVDDRLLAERKLQEAAAETELFLQSIPSILIGLGAQGEVTRWNRSAAEVFHLSSAQVIGLPIDDCGIRWLHPEMGFEVSRWLQTEDAYRCEDLAYQEGNHHRYVGFSVNRIATKADHPTHFLLTGADVTDRKALEGQLRQAQKLEAIGQLAAGVAHEINTPTQYVGDNIRFLRESWNGIADLLQLSCSIRQQSEAGTPWKDLLDRLDKTAEESDLPYLLQEVPRAIDQSLEGVERVARIVKAMKDFSHPGSDEKRPIDVNQAIESTVAVARHEWKYVSMVVTDFDKDLPLVPCLIGEFNQVMLNLIVNAAHAIAAAVAEGLRDKGTITIRTCREGDCAEIAVEDTGTGIPEHLRSRVFEPFFTTKPVGQGTGQGLTIAHSVVVNHHQGRIWFETEVGCGTTFFIRLPLQLTPEVP